MISEGSCDTEDWRNDAEHSALRHRNKFRKPILEIAIRFHNTRRENQKGVSDISPTLQEGQNKKLP